jgi:hypothetical protein
MKAAINTLFLCALLVVVFNADQSVKPIDYFVYYFPSKDILVCSDRQQTDGTEMSNELENGNFVTCLVDIGGNGVYSLNLLLASVEDGSFNHPPKVDINIANTGVFRDVDFSEDKVTKTIYLAKENSRLLYNADCEGDISKCEFIGVPKALIEDKLLKLNFILKRPKLFDTVLLERDDKEDKDKEDKKEKVPFDIDQDCDEDCGEHGICNEGKCLCRSGYKGDDCSDGI